jgi:hypothetical protein
MPTLSKSPQVDVTFLRALLGPQIKGDGIELGKVIVKLV